MSVGDTTVILGVFDVGGQALKSRMLNNLLHATDAILFVYDITNVGSFSKIEDWIKVVHKFYQINEPSKIPMESRLPYLGLVGHKGMYLN